MIAPADLKERLPAWFLQYNEEPVVTRRLGNWVYVAGLGWLLDGTTIVLDFDSLDSGGDRKGVYNVEYSPRGTLTTPISHYLRESMEWVEKELDYYLGKTDQFSYQTRPWVPPWAS